MKFFQPTKVLMNYSLKISIVLLVSALFLISCKKSQPTTATSTPNAGATPVATAVATPAPDPATEADLKQLRQTMEQEMKDQPENVHYNMGSAYLLARKSSEAAGEFKLALAINAKDMASLTGLGRADAQQNLFTEAIAEYQKAININPNDATARLALG